MSIKIKICGVKTPEALDALIESGADYFGLVFYAKSPRHLSHEAARSLVERAAGRAKAVALLVDPEQREAARVANAVRPDFIQLHGSESPALVGKIAALTGLPVIKALGISKASDLERARSYEGVADLLLFDAETTETGDHSLPGGNGVAFDWRLLQDVKEHSHFMLSGGLNPDNVAAAIELTKAPMVDVSSGVERTLGEKDPDLIRRFISAARAAPQLG